MKELLLTAAKALIAGMFFLIGAGVVVWALDRFTSDSPKFASSPRLNPQNVSVPVGAGGVVESSLVENIPFLAVRGTIQNFEPQTWIDTDIEVVFRVDGLVVRRCREIGKYGDLPSGAKRFFMIECRDFNSPVLPKGMTYEVVPYKVVSQKEAEKK
jgi:hypothetical protein